MQPTRRQKRSDALPLPAYSVRSTAVPHILLHGAVVKIGCRPGLRQNGCRHVSEHHRRQDGLRNNGVPNLP